MYPSIAHFDVIRWLIRSGFTQSRENWSTVGLHTKSHVYINIQLWTEYSTNDATATVYRWLQRDEGGIVGELDRSPESKFPRVRAWTRLFFLFSRVLFVLTRWLPERQIAPIGGCFVAQLWAYRGRDIVSQAARIYASLLSSSGVSFDVFA